MSNTKENTIEHRKSDLKCAASTGWLAHRLVGTNLQQQQQRK
jgi:hypothetical protein